MKVQPCERLTDLEHPSGTKPLNVNKWYVLNSPLLLLFLQGNCGAIEYCLILIWTRPQGRTFEPWQWHL